MRFRWTIKELNELTDDEFVRGLIVERQSDCTNVYSPLHQRLAKLYDIVNKKIDKQAAIRHLADTTPQKIKA